MAEFAEAADDLAAAGVRFAFGGTPPVAERARAIGFFEQVFDGSELTEDVLAYLRGQPRTATGLIIRRPPSNASPGRRPTR